MPHIRDRILEFRRVPVRELRPNPHNWRVHPPEQRRALTGLLSEIGYADALLARLLADGSLELIDGHLRAEITPDATVPVLVLDVTAAEADTLLALLDPLAGLAKADDERLAALVARVETEDAAVRELLAQLASRDASAPDVSAPESDAGAEAAPPQVMPASWQVVIDCADEDQQRKVYERLTSEGFCCRVLTL